MDFGTLLSVAQKNKSSKQTNAYYQTKFAPPKKQTKQTKKLSDSIKKFLARKEEEERQKALEEKRKRENLLALRDHKAQSRINKHLKVCKAANKSVLADAIDNDNTAVTMAGPSQPDEDDYGYVSQEASAFYNQLMNKYSNAPPQKPIFSNSGKKTIKDIASTKDRVKQALKQQEVDEALGHRRKRKHTGKEAEVEVEERIEKAPEVDKGDKANKDERPKVKKRPAPPPLGFAEILKIAEKKQHEPVIIEVKPKNEEPERLMTKRQMKEYAKEKEWREKKEQRERDPDISSKTANTNSVSKLSKPQIGKIPKTSEKSTGPSVSNKPPSKTAVVTPTKKLNEKSSESRATASKSNNTKSLERDTLIEERRKLEAEKRKLEEMRQTIEEEKRKLALNKSRLEDTKSSLKSTEKSALKTKTSEKQVPLKDTKQRQSPTASIMKPKVSTIIGDKPRSYPSADLKTHKSKQMPFAKDARRPPMNNKRRIYDDEDDNEEYDSELDDFIDDGEEEESADYSKYISEIFGYDKNKYRNVDNDDDANMESSFAQQLKEEFVSAKIGIMEDLEDIRQEALEKKRKSNLKKRMKK